MTKRLKVMIADDEITIVEGILKLYNWEENNFDIVGVAYDGISAVNLALEKKPDIVLIDIDMPIKSGLEVIQEISKELPDTVYIIASGYDQYDYMRTALKLGVFDYILKPIRFDDLAKILEQARIKCIDKKLVKENEKKSNSDNIIYRIVEYMNAHLAEDITLKQLGEVFHMNPCYLSQNFKESTGINYYSYLTTVRLKEAKHLLITTKMPISEIAGLVGYSDYRVFTKFFKKNEGMLPSEYRTANK